MEARNTRSIRSHLVHLVLVSIVPIGLLAAGLLYMHWQAQEQERERAQIESMRLLAAAVDNALDSTIARLQIFARLWANSRLDERDLYEQAVQALEASGDWANIAAFRSDGTAVFRADEPFGKSLPRMRLLDMWRPVIDRQQPLVSDVVTSPVTGEKVVAVGVPVLRDGQVAYIVLASLNLRWFDALLNRQGLPEGGVAGIFDRNWKFVARGREGDQRRGTDGAAPLIEDMKRKQEGVDRYRSLNGVSVYTAWTPSRHGWSVAGATPAAPIDSAFWTYLALFAFLWTVAVCVAVWLAVDKSRRVAASLDQVQAHARRLGTGRAAADYEGSEIDEVKHALIALEAASRVVDDAMATERQARGAAEAASRAKDEFLALLGHELRNPLAAISNASSILSMSGHLPDQAELAKGVIARQTQHLKRLIDDLLDVGRVMTGKILLNREPLDLAACVRQVVGTLQTAGRLRGRRVEVDAGPAWIDGDATRIEQIIVNLLVNAAAHTAEGGHIRVRVRAEGRRALVEVRDDGAGIEPQHLSRVFDLFFQANPTPERSHGGLGIGLTLVRRLAELHGGVVTVESEGRGKGAAFAIRLPGTDAAPLPKSAAETAQPAPTKILIVEDNADERDTLRVALQLQGHEVLQAADGPSALEMARRERPAIAVLDIGLPGMDGYNVAKAVRAEHGQDISLIALTGYGTEDAARSAEDAGFDLHLTKPVTPDELVRALNLVSQAQSPLRQAAS